MIIMQDIVKHYTIGEETVRALDGVSLTVEDGEFVAVIGPSGSGKSTLMNIIGCLDVADSGTYTLDGEVIRELSDDALAAIRNKRIGFIFQGFNLLGKLNARENVELPLVYARVGAQERRERTELALERVGLKNRMDHKPNELSGGQQQRVAVARALVTRPSLILADEPTGNLDSRTGLEILDLFHEIHSEGNTIVLITHDPSIAAKAQRRVNILDGKIYGDAQ